MVEMLLVRGLRGDWASVDTLAVLTWEQWSSGAPTLALADTHVTLSSHPTTADTQVQDQDDIQCSPPAPCQFLISIMSRHVTCHVMSSMFVMITRKHGRLKIVIVYER